MIELTQSGTVIETQFDLLGSKEDDLTAALGWMLSRSKCLLKQLSHQLRLDALSEAESIFLQSYSDQGFTDVEIWNHGEAVAIIEAKIGVSTPGRAQLEKYARRPKFRCDPGEKVIVVLTDHQANVARSLSNVGTHIDGIKLVFLSWRDFLPMVRKAISEERSNFTKRSLRDFHRYIQKNVTMKNSESNLVYVVALSHRQFGRPGYTFIDYVVKDHTYFHPIGRRYPTEPPNYLGFRYDGKLQSIHHVESYETAENLSQGFDDFPYSEETDPHFIYRLGPAIHPLKETRSGKGMRDRRVKIPIDILLLSNTVREAEIMAKERLDKDQISPPKR